MESPWGALCETGSPVVTVADPVTTGVLVVHPAFGADECGNHLSSFLSLFSLAFILLFFLEWYDYDV